MKTYDFEHGKQGPVIKTNKVPVSIRVDPDVLAWYRDRVRDGAGSYQALMNEALRAYMNGAVQREQEADLSKTLRRVVREELKRALGTTEPVRTP